MLQNLLMPRVRQEQISAVCGNKQTLSRHGSTGLQLDVEFMRASDTVREASKNDSTRELELIVITSGFAAASVH